MITVSFGISTILVTHAITLVVVVVVVVVLVVVVFIVVVVMDVAVLVVAVGVVDKALALVVVVIVAAGNHCLQKSNIHITYGMWCFVARNTVTDIQHHTILQFLWSLNFNNGKRANF